MDYKRKLALILNIKQILIRLIFVLDSLPPHPTVAKEPGSGIVKDSLDN